MHNACLVAKGLNNFLQFCPQQIIKVEPNLDCFQHSYGQVNAEIWGFLGVLVPEKIKRFKFDTDNCV